MKKKLLTTLLAASFATPALAWTTGFGVNASLDNALGLQFEYNLEHSTKAPLILQGFIKDYARTYNDHGTYRWRYTGIGAAILVDLNEPLRMSHHWHPFVGAGLCAVHATLYDTNLGLSSPVGGGLYLTGGVRYNITPQFNIEGSYNNFGGITLGANLMF